MLTPGFGLPSKVRMHIGFIIFCFRLFAEMVKEDKDPMTLQLLYSLNPVLKQYESVQ
jgi:hypothetical protein